MYKYPLDSVRSLPDERETCELMEELDDVQEIADLRKVQVELYTGTEFIHCNRVS